MSGEGARPGGAPAYDAEYYSSVFRAEGAQRYWADRWYARLAERLLRRTGGRRVLDVGCGQGYLLSRLSPEVEAWGLEVSEFGAGRCAEIAPRARVVTGSIEEGLPETLAPGSFDVVVARYLFEHLADPASGMARCAALLRPGGWLFFSVPNTESPGLRMKGKDWFGYGDATHVSLLPPAEWRRLVAASGLRLEKVFSDGLWDVPYVRGIPRLVQYGLFSLPTIFAVFFLLDVLPLSWGENLIAYARKPEGAPGASAG